MLTLRALIPPPEAAVTTLLLAVVWAGAFVLALRWARAWLIPIAALPYAVVFVACANVRIYSIHGMIHTPIVYRILESGMPPENPWFAGVPIHYPWTYHALIAGLSSALDLAPSWLFAAGNMLALVAICVLIAKISDLYHRDPVTAALAVFLAVFGSFGLEMATVMRQHDVPGFWSVLALPFSKKLVNQNSMPAGLALFLLGVYAVLRALSADGRARGAQAAFAAALVANAVLYPWTWLGLVAVAGGCISYTLLFVPAQRRNAAVAAAVGVVTTALLMPYLRSLTEDKAPGTGLFPETDPAGWVPYAVHVLLLLLPLWLLLGARAQALLRELRAGHTVARLLVVAAAALIASFVLVRQVSGAEYKLRALATIPLAVLAAPALASLWRRHPTVTFGLIAYLAWPAVYDIMHKVSVQRPVQDPLVEQGYALRHLDPDEDAMYQWLLAHTPGDAVVVDTEATVPAFARRSIYVAGDVGDGWNGWNHPPEVWLYWVHGVGRDAFAARRRIVAGLYGQTGDVGDAEIAAALRRFEPRPVYALARDARSDEILGSRPFLERVAEGHGWAVYRLAAGS